MKPRLRVLRRADECVACETYLPVGATAWWDGQAKAVTCATCHDAKVAPADAPPALEIRGRVLLTRRGLGKRLDADGPLSVVEIEAIAEALAAALPRA